MSGLPGEPQGGSGDPAASPAVKVEAGSDVPAGVAVVIPDPTGELADQFARIGEWLRWADCDTDEEASLLDRGASAAADLADTIAGHQRPLVAPDGTGLAPITVIPAETARTAQAALQAALKTAGQRDEHAAPCLAALDLLAACAGHDTSTDTPAALLARSVASGEGVPCRLHPAAYSAYRHHIANVVADPLDRFAAVGPVTTPDPAHPGPDRQPPVGPGDEVLVAGEHGTFVIRSLSRDGSVIAYATGGNGGARAFRPEWCVPAWKDTKKGRVRLRSVPVEARRARAEWRACHGLAYRHMERENPAITGETLGISL